MSEERPPSFWQTVGSVLAAFFGVQSSKNRQRDFTRGNPKVFIVVGLLVTAAFILTVWMAVKFALSQVASP